MSEFKYIHFYGVTNSCIDINRRDETIRSITKIERKDHKMSPSSVIFGIGLRMDPKGWLSRLHQELADRRQCRRLADLDPYLLQDMGILRAEAEKLAAGQKLRRRIPRDHI
jgi:uncharacterized protein YjiS (DUF1127 family)